MLKRLTAILAMAAGLAMAGDMLVEEPEGQGAPPINPEQESAHWHSDRTGLSAKDREAIQARRKQVEKMAESIRKKREALEQSGGDEKERRSRELKELILDDDKDLNKKEESSEKEIQKKEEIREKRFEKLREKAEHGKHHDDDGPGPPKKEN